MTDFNLNVGGKNVEINKTSSWLQPTGGFLHIFHVMLI
jgi:hypothetical protein